MFTNTPARDQTTTNILLPFPFTTEYFTREREEASEREAEPQWLTIATSIFVMNDTRRELSLKSA